MTSGAAAQALARAANDFAQFDAHRHGFIDKDDFIQCESDVWARAVDARDGSAACAHTAICFQSSSNAA